jgi:hypothetical protein
MSFVLTNSLQARKLITILQENPGKQAFYLFGKDEEAINRNECLEAVKAYLFSKTNSAEWQNIDPEDIEKNLTKIGDLLDEILAQPEGSNLPKNLQELVAEKDQALAARSTQGQNTGGNRIVTATNLTLAQQMEIIRGHEAKLKGLDAAVFKEITRNNELGLDLSLEQNQHIVLNSVRQTVRNVEAQIAKAVLAGQKFENVKDEILRPLYQHAEGVTISTTGTIAIIRDHAKKIFESPVLQKELVTYALTKAKSLGINNLVEEYKKYLPADEALKAAAEFEEVARDPSYSPQDAFVIAGRRVNSHFIGKMESYIQTAIENGELTAENVEEGVQKSFSVANDYANFKIRPVLSDGETGQALHLDKIVHNGQEISIAQLHKDINAARVAQGKVPVDRFTVEAAFYDQTALKEIAKEDKIILTEQHGNEAASQYLSNIESDDFGHLITEVRGTTEAIGGAYKGIYNKLINPIAAGSTDKGSIAAEGRKQLFSLVQKVSPKNFETLRKSFSAVTKLTSALESSKLGFVYKGFMSGGLRGVAYEGSKKLFKVATARASAYLVRKALVWSASTGFKGFIGRGILKVAAWGGIKQAAKVVVKSAAAAVMKKAAVWALKKGLISLVGKGLLKLGAIVGANVIPVAGQVISIALIALEVLNIVKSITVGLAKTISKKLQEGTVLEEINGLFDLGKFSKLKWIGILGTGALALVGGIAAPVLSFFAGSLGSILGTLGGAVLGGGLGGGVLGSLGGAVGGAFAGPKIGTMLNNFFGAKGGLSNIFAKGGEALNHLFNGVGSGEIASSMGTVSSVGAAGAMGVGSFIVMTSLATAFSLPPFDKLSDYFEQGKKQNYMCVDSSGNKIVLPGNFPNRWPVNSGWVTAGVNTYTGASTHTNAIDIGAPVGTPIYATHNGTVITAAWSDKGYGRFVVISGKTDSGETFRTLYAHMSVIIAHEGQEVKAGDLIGEMGSTGNSTGPHIHYELFLDSSGQNQYFAKISVACSLPISEAELSRINAGCVEASNCNCKVD